MLKVVRLAIVCSSLAYIPDTFSIEAKIETNNTQFSEKFLQKQINQNVTIGRAIKTIVGHYPQRAASIVGTALDLYP